MASDRDSLSRAFGLDWLLHPITSADFFRTYWETRPLLLSRGEPRYFSELPGLDSVEELISATIPNATRSGDDARIVRSDPTGVASQRSVKMHSSGLPDIQDAYRAYQDGHSLVVNQLHRRSATVALLCKSLEVASHHQVGANLYLTPRNSQGFSPHVDTHDVFILQLHGSKEWHVATSSEGLPVARAKQTSGASFGDFDRITLLPGDILYLPRGFRHEAVTSGSSSLHLTVGIHVFTWADLMREAVDLLAEERAEFRRALPPRFLDVSLTTADVKTLTGALVELLGDAALAERAKGRLGTKLLATAKASGPGHFRSLDGLGELTGESVVERPPGTVCVVRSDAKEVLLEFETNYISGPPRIGSALSFIAERDQFSVRELPGELSLEDKLDLVKRLVSEGLLQIPTQ